MPCTSSVRAGALAIAVLLTAACSAEPAKETGDYRVVTEQVTNLPSHGKLSQYVLVDARSDEAKLRSILADLHAKALRRSWKSESPPGVWIYLYFDENDATEQRDQWVALLSDSPIGDPKVMVASVVTSPVEPPALEKSQELIGVWRYAGSGMHWVETLYREGGEVKREMRFDDGSSSIARVVETRHPDGIRYTDPENEFGEFVVVLRDGKLGQYGPNGRFGTADAVQLGRGLDVQGKETEAGHSERELAAHAARARALAFWLLREGSPHCATPEPIAAGKVYPLVKTGCALSPLDSGLLEPPKAVESGVVRVDMGGSFGVRYAAESDVFKD